MRDVPPNMVGIWQNGDFTGPHRPMARVTVQKASTALYEHTFPIMAATEAEVARRKEAAGAALGTTPELTGPSEQKTKKTATNVYASTIFGHREDGAIEVPMELHNLKSVSWSRSVDSDVAEARFEFYNTAPLELGGHPARDELGFYTFDRGMTAQSMRWGHQPNEFAGLLVPDNIIRTYEGYGFDPAEVPERDPNLVQTGVWIIDQVDLRADGMIQVTARDPARLLMDHMAFLPVIPPDFYPLSFAKVAKTSGWMPEMTYNSPITVKGEEATDIGVVTSPPDGPTRFKNIKLTYLGSTDKIKDPPTWINYTVVKGDYLIKLARRFNVPGGWRTIAEANEDVFEQRGTGVNYKPKSPHWIYPGQVFRIPTSGGGMFGHATSDAFDGNGGSYWLSHGFPEGSITREHEVEWIEGRVGNTSVGQVRFTTSHAGYSVYVSVRSNGKWVKAAGTINYKPPKNGPDLKASIPYVKQAVVFKANREVVVTFDKSLPKVDRIRLTFKNLPKINGRRRVGLKNFSAYANVAVPAVTQKQIETLPGYRGVDDSFDRAAPGGNTVKIPASWKPEKGPLILAKDLRGLGSTPKKDKWSTGRFTIRPRGIAARKIYPGEEVWDRDNSLESFQPATLDLKVRHQVVTLHTKYTATTKDDPMARYGRWCIYLRATNNGYENSVRVYIDNDGAITAYLHSKNAEGYPAFVDVGSVTAGDFDLNEDPYEITASLIGNDLVVAMRKVGDTEAPTVRLQLHDKRFATWKGTEAGFGTGNYGSGVTRFISRTRFRRGVHDSFDRPAAKVLGKAETGQTWRHAANTWKIVNKDARQTSNAELTQLALIDMFDSDQDVVLDVANFGADGQVVIALRATDTRNLIVVRFTPEDIRVETRIKGVNTIIHTHAYDTSGLDMPVKLRARIIAATVSVSVDWQELFFVTDLRFADDAFGYHVGMGARDSGARIREFTANYLPRDIRDSFKRPNASVLGLATGTGQLWRAPVNTWRIVDGEAQQPTSTEDTVLAYANLYDSEQDVTINVVSTGVARTAIITLRTDDADNTILARLTPDKVMVETVVQGVTTVLKTHELPSTPTVPFELRAKVVENTVTVYVGDKAYVVTSDQFTNDRFGFHAGFGTKGSGARLEDFNAKSLNTSDTWTYMAETTVPAHFEPGSGAKPGTYEDYTDIVKLLCAWGGFYWPRDALQVYSDGTENPLRPQKPDATLGTEEVGRVWGDFEMTGTAGDTPLDWSMWDKKSLMDGIVQVREMIGFLFYIDELGGIVWRNPNVFDVGNNVSSFSKDPRRTNYIYDIDEHRTLLDLRTALNSRNVRERVFIANVGATQAGLASGFNPNPTGLRRVGGWTDQHFKSQEECQVMADMITLRQLFRYRTSSSIIPALPAIQIDDQVRIWEQVTNEGHVHYVRGITSTNDLAAGNWTYDLETHWLGEDPFESWVFDSSTFPEETQAFLEALRLKSGVGTTAYYELPRTDTATMPIIPGSPDGYTTIEEESEATPHVKVDDS